MDKMGKLFFVITLPKSSILVKDLVHSLFLSCKLIKSHRNLKLKVRTVFQNVWGEYKYHGNPYIQGTIHRTLSYLLSLCYSFSHFVDVCRSGDVLSGHAVLM